MKLKTKFQDEDFELGEVVKAKVTTYYDENKVVVMADKARGGVSRFEYNSIKDFTDHWEDYRGPKEYKYVLPNKVRRAILSWVKAQDNPIEKIGILLTSYYDTHEVDPDGFYNYEFYGYVGDNNKNLVANTLSIRLKKPFDYEENKDYTLLELGIVDNFGGEE